MDITIHRAAFAAKKYNFGYLIDGLNARFRPIHTVCIVALTPTKFLIFDTHFLGG